MKVKVVWTSFEQLPNTLKYNNHTHLLELGDVSGSFEEVTTKASELYKIWASDNPEKISRSWIVIE